MIEQKMTALDDVDLARPRDKSLAAFKEWIRESAKRLSGNSDGDASLSEDDWIILWQDFVLNES